MRDPLTRWDRSHLAPIQSRRLPDSVALCDPRRPRHPSCLQTETYQQPSPDEEILHLIALVVDNSGEMGKPSELIVTGAGLTVGHIMTDQMT